MVMAITFGVEGAILMVVLCYGMYLRARHEADIEISKVSKSTAGSAEYLQQAAYRTRNSLANPG